MPGGEQRHGAARTTGVFHRVSSQWRRVPLTGLPADVWITFGGGRDTNHVWGVGSSSAGADTWLFNGHTWQAVAIPGLQSSVGGMTAIGIDGAGRVTACGLDGSQPEQHLVIVTTG